MKKLGLAKFLITLAASIAFLLLGHKALAFNGNNLMDDGIFDKVNSMNAGDINSWLNANFPNSCISTNHGFSSVDPTGYSPSAGFTYGGPVSAGQVIYDSAQVYGINPQVLLVTLQKEQSLVAGDAGCSVLRYAAATGYGCPDGGTTHDYSGLNPALYYINGSPVTSVSGTCVNTAVKTGFSQQVIRAAWLLKFGEQRSEGNTSWAVIKGNWDNSDDPQTCYGGPMTQGYRKRCSSDSSAAYYDGYTTIDGSSTHMDTGATAAFYWYTPHFAGNQNFDSLFQSWFGSIYDVYSWSIISQYAYTDQTKSAAVDSTSLAPGQRIYVGFVAKNTGDTTWSNSGSNPMHVGTTSPQDRISTFCDSTWLNCNRPAAMQEATVAPGQTGTFEFWYKYGGSGTFKEHFSLVAEGLKWLNDPGLYFYTVDQPPTYLWSGVGQSSYTDNTKATGVDSTRITLGNKIYLAIQAKNTGNMTWSNNGANPTRLGSSSPQDRISTFCDSTWLNCNRPAAMQEATVAPGQTGTFEFWYNPSRTGIFREFFKPVIDGLSWTNDTGLNFYTEVDFSTAGTTSSLSSGQSLSAGQSIVSTDGRYKLAMQSDGNLVVYSISRPLWSSHTAGTSANRVAMQSDGNLVVYDSQNRALWASNTAGKGSSSLVMQSDGNLVVYNLANKATWASNTANQL